VTVHLLIDAQPLQTPGSRLRGIGRYSSNLLRALAAARPDWRIEVVQNAALPSIADDDRDGLPVLSFQPPLSQQGEHLEVNERYYADWLTARGADGVLLLSHCEGCEAVVPSFCGRRPRVFGIAYDLIPLLYPQHYLTDLGIARWYAHRFRQLLDSDALLAISEATARDVRTLGGEQAPPVVNIGGAVDPLFAPLPADELIARAARLRERFGLKRAFILYVGALDYRKNLRGALRAFAMLPVDVRRSLDLAVVCRFESAEQATVEAMMLQASVGDEVKWIRSADDQDLRALYQMCRLFFFPSFYEGLGLPVLEALHCGAPVVTSNCSSLPEYAGPASWLGDPTSPQEMARLLQEALTEPREARREEREAFARTYSWQKTAERACAVLERYIMQCVRETPRRRRLAWVVPLTPQTSRMADYAAELLPFLSERFDIELIADHERIAAPETLLRNHLILTPQEVARRHAAQPYDLFVYHLSSSRQHEYLLHLLRRFPGLAVLHDGSAAGLASLAESILGMLVHSTSALQQARGVVNVPVVLLPTPSALHSYAAWIDQAISRHERSDGLWRAFAVQCLAECADGVDALIDSWAALRSQGQRRFAFGERDRVGTPRVCFSGR
jgi:glycosyltransferase involved in cell wall biosynthesis